MLNSRRARGLRSESTTSRGVCLILWLMLAVVKIAVIAYPSSGRRGENEK